MTTVEGSPSSADCSPDGSVYDMAECLELPAICKDMDERDNRIMKILGIDLSSIYSINEYSLKEYMKCAVERTPNDKQIFTFRLDTDMISCTNWKGEHYISGPDVVRLILFRFKNFTHSTPLNAKKFEEGVFSDLRRFLVIKDCIMEPTQSELVLFLYSLNAVRSKKKQKIYHFQTLVARFQVMFFDALERELTRKIMANAVGMEVEEFIKAGAGMSVITDPQPFSAHEFDWTIKSLANIHGKPFLTLTQLGIIRTDIQHWFQRYIRAPILEAETREFSNEKLEWSINTDFNRRVALRTCSVEGDVIECVDEGLWGKVTRKCIISEKFQPLYHNSPNLVLTGDSSWDSFLIADTGRCEPAVRTGKHREIREARSTTSDTLFNAVDKLGEIDKHHVRKSDRTSKMLPITSDFLDESSTSDEQSVNDNPDGDQSDAYSDSTLSSNGEEYHLAPNDLGYIRSRADYWHSRRNTPYEPMSPHLSMILPLPIEVQYRQRWKSLYGDDIKNGGFNNTVKKENHPPSVEIEGDHCSNCSTVKTRRWHTFRSTKLCDDCAEYYAMYQENRPVERIVNGAIVQLNDEGREVCQEPSCHVNKSSRWRVGSKGERLCNSCYAKWRKRVREFSMNAPDGVLDLGNIPLNTIFVDRRVGRPKNSIEGSSSPNFDPTIRRESKDSVFTDVSMNNSRAGHKVVRRESIESIDEDGLLKTCSQCATTKTIRWRFGENQALVCNACYSNWRKTVRASRADEDTKKGNPGRTSTRPRRQRANAKSLNEAEPVCEICQLNEETDLLLLCDSTGCGRACHLSCHSPPLENVPKYDWFCSHCRSGEFQNVDENVNTLNGNQDELNNSQEQFSVQVEEYKRRKLSHD